MENNSIENDPINIIKSISPLNIKDYDNSKLINLINNEKNKFFENINPKVLKLINIEVIKSIQVKTFKSLSINNFNKLLQTEKIKYFPNDFLNSIKIDYYPNLQNKFYTNITVEQFSKAKDAVIKKWIEIHKISHLNKSVFKCFYERVQFEKLDINNIIYLLGELKKKKKYEYLTIDNFNSLQNYIGKNEKLNLYLEDLINRKFSDNKNNDIETTYRENILNENDIKINDNKEIKNENISKTIENYLNNDYYFLLKDYCINCCENSENKKIMLESLKDILNYPNNIFFDFLKKLDILRILIIVENNKKNILNYYADFIKEIYQINNLELNDCVEFESKINKFSEIIKEGLFADYFLEILAEENLRTIKVFLSEKFTGTDKNAIPENLRKKYVDLINEYLNVLAKKYNIKEEEILRNLQKIEGDNKEEIELKLKVYINSLNEHEKLYYDLLMQSIIEKPTLENKTEAVVTTIFKYVRDIGITLIGTKYASLTGSKSLTFLTASLGVAKLIKNISDDVANSYFSLSEEERKIIYINRRNSPETTFNIIKKKIKEKYRKIYRPIKNYFNTMIRKNILKIKEEPKIGFEKFTKNLNDVESFEEECLFYRDNNIKNHIKYLKEMNEKNTIPIYLKIQKKYQDHNINKKSNKLIKFFKVKEKINNYLIKIKKDKLYKEYPEFEDTLKNKGKLFIEKMSSFFKGCYNGIMNNITFSFIDYRIKPNHSELRENMIKSIKYNEFQKNLDLIDKFIDECKIKNLEEEISFLVKSNPKDERIFKLIEGNKKNKLVEIEKLEKNLEIINEISLNSKNINFKIDNIDLNNEINEEGIILDDSIEQFI